MDSAHGWKSMNIDATIKKMFQLYKQKPVLFAGIVLLVDIPLYLFTTYVMLPYFPIWLSLILNIVLAILAGILTVGGLIHAAGKVSEGKDANIMECYQFALGKTSQYIVLFFRILWYTWAWVLILIMILFAVTNTAFMSIGMNPSFASTNTAYAQGMIDSGDFDMDAFNEAMAELESMDYDSYGDFDYTGSMNFGGMNSYGSGIGMPFNPASMLMGGGILNLILMLAFIVIGIFVLIRSVRVVFAYYSLFASSNDSKAALEESIKLAKGNWWTILGYALVAAFVMLLVIIGLGIVAGILGAIIGNVHFMVFLNIIVQAIALPLPILFYYTFYHNMKKVN